MSNISPTIKVNISRKLGIVKEILLGATCSPKELTSYKFLFQEYRNIFTWTYSKMLGISPTIVEHHIDTWPDAHPFGKNNVNSILLKSK